jgi:hypothetical protein
VLDKIFDSIIGTKLTPGAFFICFGVSLVLGFCIAFAFMFRNRYTKSFVVTLTIIPAVIQLLIMLVSGNIGTGIGVAGAFSLVRFRSAQGSAREIGFVFMSTAVGWKDHFETTFGDLPISVISRQHLIVNKKSAGRLQDLADVEQLENFE